MNVLIIGGSRFSGRIVIDNLLKNEHNVTVVNRGLAEKSHPPFIQEKQFRYQKGVNVLHADRTKKEEFAGVIGNKKFQAIIDMCAYNVKDIENVLDVTNYNLENYVCISTASVYDDEKIIFLPILEDGPFGSEDENFPEKYSRDKRRVESFLRKKYYENNLPITLIRPTYIYGPNNPVYREFYFFDRIMNQEKLCIPGSGEYIFDFVYSKDVAWLATVPLENKKAIGQCYNATGEGALTLNNYIKILSEIIGKESEIIHYNPDILNNTELKPQNNFQMFPYTYDRHFLLSKEKANLDLGYKPTRFFDSMKQTFQWYLKNKNPDWKGDYELDKKITGFFNKEYKK